MASESAPDYFLFSYLKERMYINYKPETLEDLKDIIRRGVRAITPDLLRSPMNNVLVGAPRALLLRINIGMISSSALSSSKSHYFQLLMDHN